MILEIDSTYLHNMKMILGSFVYVPLQRELWPRTYTDLAS